MGQKIKLIIGLIITAIIIGLGITITTMSNRIDKLNREIAEATTNIKAYELENSALKGNTIEFQYTIEQLNHSKDSLNQKINKFLFLNFTIRILFINFNINYLMFLLESSYK